MPLLKIIEQDEATGRVAEIYESMVSTMGFVPNAFKVFSPSTFLLDRQVSSLQYNMRHKTLGGKLLAFIRLLVAGQEHCDYCVGMNSGILLHYGVLPQMITEVIADHSKAPLEEKDLAMLLFVLSVVKNSKAIVQADVDKLRNLGWTDTDIMEATFHGTSAVGVDRIFNAFKVESDR